MTGKSYIKIGSTNWDRIKKMYVKTGGQTWTAIRKAYVKTVNGWEKVFDTASNRPFIRNNDIPKIRLNTFRTDSSYNPTGTIDDPVNPVVEAPPVQKMGPNYTSPVLGWPYEAIGRHLWGYDGDWVSGNGSAMTFVYSWLYNLSGNRNDNIEEVNATSTTGRTDMLTNLSSHLGQSDGEYFDRNFLTFRVTATNSAGSASFESAQVYIVRDTPTGSITMTEKDIASPNNTMSATFSYSSSWYNKVDTAESYVEWFAVDNLGDTLTTSNRVQIENLNTFTVTGTTTKSGTTFHVPTLTNKYYYVRLTLNNSNTLPAKYNGSVINVVGFTPNAAVTALDNKTAKTTAANGPFNLTNGTKTGRYYDVASSTWRRYVSVDIGQSSSADRYEVQIEGQYEGSSGSYNLSSASWVVLQTLSVAPYVLESSRIGGTLTMPSVSALNYLNYRFTARSRNGTSLNGAAYSNGGTSTSFQYVSAASVAPSAPSISNIATSTDFQGSFVTFTNYMASTGSNEISYYTYSVDNGSNFQQPTNGFINANEGKVYVTAGSTVNLRIRATNLDGETSASSNLLSITAAVVPAVPTSVVVKSFSSLQGTIFLTAGANTQSVQGYLEYDSFSTFDYIDGYVNVSANSAGKIQLSGANSATRSYTAGVRPFSGQNLSGGSGAISTITTKVLNGSDNMQVSLGTITLSGTRTINLTWTLSAGAPTHYIARLYQYSGGSVISTKTITAPTTSVSFNESDGVQFSTQYYIGIQPQYQYTSSVTYEDTNYVSSNITTSANLTAPTPTGVTYTDDGNFNISFTGGSGPYYQLWWATTTGTIANSLFDQYDAASTGTPIKELPMAANGSTYYFWTRSSNQNLGNTTSGGTASSGTYSPWSSTNVSITAAQPSGGSASIAGSSTVGSTLTLSISDASGTPSPIRAYIIWRRNDGGPGGNSFTGGSIMQYGGTTYTIDSPLVAYSSVGYSIRAEVNWANGVGTAQIVNTNAIVVTATATKLSTPTNFSASDARTDGIQVSWTNVSNAATYGVWWGGVPGYDNNPDFGGPNNNGGVSITSSPFLDTGAPVGSRTYYVQAFPSSGSTSFLKSDWSAGDSGTRLAAPVKLSTPTGVSASDNRTDGVNITWNAVSGSAYYGIWWGGPPGYDNNPDFGGPNNAGGWNGIGTSFLDTTISVGSSRSYYVQAYASGNPTGTKSDWGGGDTGTRVSAPSTPAPVLSSISGNNSLALGGTFTWSYTNSPTAYSIFVQGPTGTVFTTSNAYTYTGTSFRPGYDGTGWQGSGNYTLYVSARNSGGDSVVSSQTTYMS